MFGLGLNYNTPFFILVDPVDDFGTTTRIKDKLLEENIELVNLYSPTISRVLLNDKKGLSMDEISHIQQHTYSTTSELIARMPSIDSCLGILCESDAGLRFSEDLGQELLPAMYTKRESRRDKYQMMNDLKTAGMDHIKQVLTNSWKCAEEFLSSPSMINQNCVLKPARGVASIGVAQAETMAEACEKFHALLKSSDNLGYSNNAIQNDILVQEFVEGPEFAIDTVSRNGSHKILASWKYDKRSLNGAPFVYFCSEAIDANMEPRLADVHNYIFEVLNALNIKWGPCHIEVKIRESGEFSMSPVLIEANCGRWHGQDFIAIANMAFGFNAVDAAIDAYSSLKIENQEADIRWNAIPRVHCPLRCFGRIMHLSSYFSGALSTPMLGSSEEEMQTYLPSLFTWRPFYRGEIGEIVQKTIDLRSTAGYAIMISQSKDALDEEYSQLLEFQKFMFTIE